MSGPAAVVAYNPLSGFAQKIEWYIPNQYNGSAAASQDHSKWQNYCAYFLRHAQKNPAVCTHATANIR